MVSSHSHSSLKMSEGGMDYFYVCYGSIMYLYIYAISNKARVFHTHFNIFAQ